LYREVIEVFPNATSQNPDETDAFEVSLHFEVEDHPFFVRKKNDVHIEVPITYSQVCGCSNYCINLVIGFIRLFWETLFKCQAFMVEQ
jgi:DnaJ-class molecular chaperone